MSAPWRSWRGWWRCEHKADFDEHGDGPGPAGWAEDRYPASSDAAAVWDSLPDADGKHLAALLRPDWERRRILYWTGDILWVRETWQFIPCIDCRLCIHGGCRDTPVTYEDKDSVSEGCFVYRADYPEPDRLYWHPSIHMPRQAARIFLRVTGVRVERLQDIDDDGVLSEGLEIGAPFDELWNRTVKPKDRPLYGWEANPWVWVIGFERISRPPEGER